MNKLKPGYYEDGQCQLAIIYPDGSVEMFFEGMNEWIHFDDLVVHWDEDKDYLGPL